MQKQPFFCVGSNTEKYPEILKAIIDEGHTIGNHTYNHLKGWKHKTKDYLVDVELAQKAINKISLSNSKLYLTATFNFLDFKRLF